MRLICLSSDSNFSIIELNNGHQNLVLIFDTDARIYYGNRITKE
jgi:hypothetical protein